MTGASFSSAVDLAGFAVVALVTDTAASPVVQRRAVLNRAMSPTSGTFTCAEPTSEALVAYDAAVLVVVIPTVSMAAAVADIQRTAASRAPFGLNVDLAPVFLAKIMAD